MLGALAQLSKAWAPTGTLFAITHGIMPFLYWYIRVGIWSYEIEELAMWAAWLSARTLLGGAPIDLLPLTLALWLPGATFGGGTCIDSFSKRSGMIPEVFGRKPK